MNSQKTGQYALNIIENEYEIKGGLIDCHQHLDRRNTLNKEGYTLIENGATLKQKQDYIDEFKRKPDYKAALYDRILEGVSDMGIQGIKGCRSYIDADATIGLEAINAALKVKGQAMNQGFYLQIAASPVKGLFFNEDRIQFELGCELADVIGVIPSRGIKIPDPTLPFDYQTLQENMKYFFEVAWRLKKPIDLQIDQANDTREWESKILCGVAREFRNRGYTHSIATTHCISLGAQTLVEIKRIAKEFKALGIHVIVCPGAALDMKQDRKQHGPTRNSIAPVKELLEEGVVVALGTDNVSDIFMRFSSGDFRTEIEKLTNAVRWQEDLSLLADLATTNGRLVLGLPLPH